MFSLIKLFLFVPHILLPFVPNIASTLAPFIRLLAKTILETLRLIHTTGTPQGDTPPVPVPPPFLDASHTRPIGVSLADGRRPRPARVPVLLAVGLGVVDTHTAPAKAVVLPSATVALGLGPVLDPARPHTRPVPPRPGVEVTAVANADSAGRPS